MPRELKLDLGAAVLTAGLSALVFLKPTQSLAIIATALQIPVICVSTFLVYALIRAGLQYLVQDWPPDKD